MKKKLLTTVTLVAGLVAVSAQAMACPPGYKSVKHQSSGNWICVLDVGGPNNLTSTPPPIQGMSMSAAKKSRARRRRN